jgi:outer membrane biosynthesis protein TonB
LTAELIGWLDEDSLDHRQRMRNAMLVSLAIHGLVIALFAVSPPAQFTPLPNVLSVELVAAPPTAQPTPRAKPSPPPKAAPSEPAAPPPPTPTPAPPVAKAPVQVLPEEAPGRIRKAKPKVAPRIEAKPKPKPEPKQVPWRPKREKSLSYEDAMAALGDELGVDETTDALTPAPKRDEDSNAEAPSQRARPGAAISPELAAWNLAVQRLIQSKWVTPSSHRGRGFATSLELRLSASGELVGTPVVIRSSGDPFFDDNAVRALLTVAPLPPVTKPGRRIFIFRSEAN